MTGDVFKNKKKKKMDYIVLDLEWNQAPGKFDKDTMLPFEIVEIGAVKLK